MTHAPDTLRDDELEQNLLGALLLSPQHYETVSPIIVADDFYTTQHADVWRTIQRLHADSEPIDAATVADALSTLHPRAEAWDLCITLTQHVCVAANAPRYAAGVHAIGTERRLAQAAKLVADDPTPSHVDALERAISDRRSTTGSARIQTTEEVIDAWIAGISADDGTRLTTGWPTIDHAIGGIRLGDVVILGARTSVGKTWLGLNLLIHALQHRPKLGAAVVSLEMTGDEMAERVSALALRITTRRAQTLAAGDQISADTIIEAEHALARVTWHDKTTTADDLPAILAHARQRVPSSCVMLVDYLGLLAWRGRKNATTYEQTSETARALKNFARTHRCALIVCAQLSREAGDGWEPVTLKTLRDSGAIEEMADVILGAWAPERRPDLNPIEREDQHGVRIVRILKARKGTDTGQTATLRFAKDEHRLVEQAPLRQVS